MKDYILRFNKEKLTIESLDEQTVLTALMHGVRVEGPLMAELAKKSTYVTLRQFLNKAKEYINQEEAIGALMKSQKDATLVKTSSDKVVPVSSGKKEEKNPKKSGNKIAPSSPRVEP